MRFGWFGRIGLLDPYQSYITAPQNKFIFLSFRGSI